eukprot:9491699-Pyramimonas_sp.AAC.1
MAVVAFGGAMNVLEALDAAQLWGGPAIDPTRIVTSEKRILDSNQLWALDAQQCGIKQEAKCSAPSVRAPAVHANVSSVECALTLGLHTDIKPLFRHTTTGEFISPPNYCVRASLPSAAATAPQGNPQGHRFDARSEPGMVARACESSAKFAMS